MGLEKEITVNIEAGARDCFYETAFSDQIIDFEYQVIDGGNLGKNCQFLLKFLVLFVPLGSQGHILVKL